MPREYQPLSKGGIETCSYPCGNPEHDHYYEEEGGIEDETGDLLDAPPICGCNCGCEPDLEWHGEPRCACVSLGCSCVQHALDPHDVDKTACGRTIAAWCPIGPTTCPECVDALRTT